MLASSLINADTDAPVDLFEHSLNQHLLIVGQTGSGKTTSTVALLSDCQRADRAAIILDPTGEYRHLPNASVYRLGDNCFLGTGELSLAQLQQALSLPNDEYWGNLLADALTSLRVAHNLCQQTTPLVKLGRSRKKWQAQVSRLGKWAHDYQVDLLPEQLIAEMILPDPKHPDYSLLGQVPDKQRIQEKWALINHLRTKLASQRFQKLFGNHNQTTSYELTYVLKLFLSQPMQHQSLVLDLSLLQGATKLQQLLVSLICQTILHLRLTESPDFPVTVVVDEAHCYLPQDPQALSANGIFQILREGRKANLAMMLTTQSPLDLAPRLRSQFGNVLLHRMSGRDELALWPDVDADAVANQPIGRATYLSAGQVIPVKVMEPQWWQKEHENGLHS